MTSPNVSSPDGDDPEALWREELHRLAIDAGEVGTWILDADAGDLYVSAMMASLMGYAPDRYRPSDTSWQQVVSRDAWMRTVHAEDRPAMETTLSASIEAKAPFELEFRIRREDGDVRWMYAKGNVVEGERAPRATGAGTSGSSVYLLGATVDVTRQKRAEQEARAQQEYAEDIVHTVREPLLVLDPDLRVETANASFYEHFQVAPEEATGRHVYEFGNGQFDAPELRALLEDILPRRTAIHDFEVEHEFEGLGRRMMHLDARQIDAKELILLAIEDVTDRNEAIHELERERSFIDRVLETVGAIVVVVDMDGHIVRANKEFENVSGYSREEFGDENVFERLIPPEDWDGVREVMEQHRRGHRHTFHENHWITKTGARRLIRWSSRAFPDGDGPVTHVIGTGLDITDRRDLERQVVAATDDERRRIGLELHDSLASQLTGATMMARSLAQRLEGKHPDVAHQIQEVADLVSASSEQARLLSHALMPLEVRSEELADGLEQLARRQEQRSGIPCSFAARGTVPKMPGEVASHLYHIVSEATTNAVKHADANTIEIRLDVDAEGLLLTVKDDGRGFPDGGGDPDGPAGAGGRTDGHGLDIMQYRSNLIGARLRMDSTEDGTTVRCRLPVEHIPGSAADP